MSLSCLWDHVINQMSKILSKKYITKKMYWVSNDKILLCLSCSIPLFVFSIDCKNLLAMRLHFQVRLDITVTVLLFDIQNIIAWLEFTWVQTPRCAQVEHCWQPVLICTVITERRIRLKGCPKDVPELWEALLGAVTGTCGRLQRFPLLVAALSGLCSKRLLRGHEHPSMCVKLVDLPSFPVFS